MKVKFKVVGANPATEHLRDKEGLMVKTYMNGPTAIRELLFGDDTYLLDQKTVDFLPDCVLINGFLSDNKENVGRVALKFIPQHEE
jgi:hypothetical protein|tara:strand:+ start:1030 stop:1287 length:258 start_codon:yes stop_codon:yes gene_type:complete